MDGLRPAPSCRVWALGCLAVLSLPVLSLGGCKPATPQAEQSGEAALLAAGYSHAPEITGVTQDGPNSLTIIGHAAPDGIVRFAYAGHSAGFTADSKGHFQAELPTGAMGGVYDVSTESGGHSEGRLFVPPGQPLRSVLMRPGASSLPLLDQSNVLAVMDYDKAGVLAVSGRVKPQEPITIRVDDEIMAHQRSDAQGFYNAVMTINPAAASVALNVSVTGTGGAKAERIITLAPAGLGAVTGDHITTVDKGWRVDWVLPGGGEQTTFVF